MRAFAEDIAGGLTRTSRLPPESLLSLVFGRTSCCACDVSNKVAVVRKKAMISFIRREDLDCPQRDLWQGRFSRQETPGFLPQPHLQAPRLSDLTAYLIVEWPVCSRVHETGLVRLGPEKH